MKTKPVWGFFIVFLMLSPVSFSRETKDEKQTGAQSLKVLVLQHFPGKLQLDIHKKIIGLLRNSGIRLIERSDEESDLLLQISLRGDPLGGYYAKAFIPAPPFAGGVWHYSGAWIDGSIEIIAKTKTIRRIVFYSSIPPKGSISEGTYLKPEDAPFRQALDTRLVCLKLGEAVGQVYGDSIRYDSLGDEDLKLGIAAAALIRKDPSHVENIIQRLKDPNEQMRMAAIRALGWIKTPRSEETLIGLTAEYSENETLIEALGKIGSPRAMDVLAGLMESKKSYRAAAALAESGDFRAIRILEAVPKTDGDENERYRVIRLLGRIDDDRALLPLLKAIGPSYTEEIIKILATRASKAIALAESVVHDEKCDKRLREQAAEALIRMKYGTSPEGFVQAFASDNSYLRYAGIIYLREIKENWSIDLSIKMLKDKDAYIRSMAAYGLRYQKDSRATSTLIEALNDNDWMVRDNAIEALGEMGDPSAVKPLIRILENKQKEDVERAVAARALGKLKDPRAVKSLIAALKSGNPNESYWGANVPGQSIIALGEIRDPQAIPPLIGALNSGNYSIEAAAAEALGKIEDQRTLKPLADKLTSDRSWVREKAIIALAKKKNPAAIDGLVAALNFHGGNGQSDAETRMVAAENLAGFDDPRISQALLDKAGDVSEVESIREAAMHALSGRIDQRIAKLFITLLNDKQTSIRRLAAELLGKAKDPAAISPLIDALRDEDASVRREVLKSLGAISDPQAIPALLGGIYDADSGVRDEAFRSLKSVTHLDIGADPTRWQSWWELSRK